MRFSTKIVGSQYCRDKVYNEMETTIFRNGKYGIFREKSNPVDANACCVIQNNNNNYKPLGYLLANVSKHISPLIDQDMIHIELNDLKKSKQIMVHLRLNHNNISDIDMITKNINELQMTLSPKIRNNNNNDDSKSESLNGFSYDDRYLYILMTMFKSCKIKYKHVFDNNEMNALDKLIEMENDNIGSDCLRLLARLVFRKMKWINTNGLHYDEIDNMKQTLLESIKRKIIENSANIGVNEDVMNSATKDQIKMFLEKSSLKNKIQQKLSKKDLVKSIILRLNKQSTVFGHKIVDTKSFKKVCILIYSIEIYWNYI